MTAQALHPALAASVTGLYTVAVSGLLWSVSTEVPEPYMDEVFHIPQAQRYCRGDFRSWDPKLTTPPGLYLAGLPYVSAVDAVRRTFRQHSTSGVLDECTTTTLRSLNTWATLVCLGLIYGTHRELHKSTSTTTSLLTALALSMMPLHVFFSALYYTDVLSTTIVLASYLASLKDRILLAATLSAVAIAVRQTNAVWAAFSLGVCVLRQLQPERAKSAGQSLPNELLHLLRMAWTLKVPLLKRFWSFLGVLAGFAVFLRWNGGVVLGDKSNHVTVLHPTQLLYLGLYVALNFAPALLWPDWHCGTARALRWGRRHPLKMVVASVLSVACCLGTIHFFTLVHPFILADNRHYVFYLWRRFLNRHWLVRYAMAIPYLHAWAGILGRLSATQGPVWICMLLVCCTAALLPAWLVEFRYFTIPTMHVVLHMDPPTNKQLLAVTAGMCATTAATNLFSFIGASYGAMEVSLDSFGDNLLANAIAVVAVAYSVGSECV
eukprot:CAMPEP_0177791162 /NCGR_PEP_ID=MMETSP0491_2-20121128/23776_1 /TAXON_ID=63592 /ORGANISM="Tetraselmis chuii, Strain PLY429" /LENGTH=491 /DNA_ID=CAMNT_0019313355 /DNA_START=42 /DNA_END=1518 /DNA_ORIENTATION=+